MASNAAAGSPAANDPSAAFKLCRFQRPAAADPHFEIALTPDLTAPTKGVTLLTTSPIKPVPNTRAASAPAEPPSTLVTMLCTCWLSPGDAACAGAPICRT